MAFSLLCGSISDTLHHRVALIGNSFRPGNFLIVSHTSAIYTRPPAGSAFTVTISIQEKGIFVLQQLASLTHVRNQMNLPLCQT